MFNLIKNLSTAILKTPDQQPSITIDDGSLKLFEKQISECELSLQTSKQHLAKIISAKIANCTASMKTLPIKKKPFY